MGVVPAGVQVHQAGGGFGVAAGVLVRHQAAELLQGRSAAVGRGPVVPVAVFQEDLAEGAVVQAQSASAIAITHLQQLAGHPAQLHTVTMGVLVS